MKHPILRFRFISLLCIMLGALAACHVNGEGEAENKDTVSLYMEPKLDNTQTSPDTMGVEVMHDDSLRTLVNNTVSGIAGVSATVNEGVVTLTGTINRSELPQLMQKINEMHPKKINNELKIK